VGIGRVEHGVILVGRWGYIDRKGEWVINPRFDRASGFSQGLASVGMGKRWGYIDKTGRYVWRSSE
jgi:hypothetical protein